MRKCSCACGEGECPRHGREDVKVSRHLWSILQVRFHSYMMQCWCTRPLYRTTVSKAAGESWIVAPADLYLYTQCYSPEDGNFRKHHRENLNYYTVWGKWQPCFVKSVKKRKSSWRWSSAYFFSFGNGCKWIIGSRPVRLSARKGPLKHIR